MEHIANMMMMSGDGFLREISACFDNHADPVSHMFDIRGLDAVQDEDLSEAVQQVLVKMTGDSVDIGIQRTYTLLMQFDMLFLHRKFMYRIADDEYQQPEEIYSEVKRLQSMSEFQDISPLQSVEYILETGEFGWRAPLWRQVVGTRGVPILHHMSG